MFTEFFGQQVNIAAPPATAVDPLIIVFTVDSARVPVGEDETTLGVYKDGVLVAECTGAPAPTESSEGLRAHTPPPEAHRRVGTPTLLARGQRP